MSGIDLELVKLLLGGGTSAILILGLLWWTQRGYPRFIESMDKHSAQMEVQRVQLLAAQKEQQERFVAQMDQQRKDFLEAMTGTLSRAAADVARNHERSIQEQAENRKERRELMVGFREERDADRASRDQLANEFQKVIAEVWMHRKRTDGTDQPENG